MTSSATNQISLMTSCSHCFAAIPPAAPSYVLCGCGANYYCDEVCQALDFMHASSLCAQEPHFIPRSISIRPLMDRFLHLIIRMNEYLPPGIDHFSFENSIMVNCLGFDRVTQQATCWSLLVKKTTVLQPDYCNPPLPPNNPIAVAFREHILYLKMMVSQPNLAVIQTFWYDPSVTSNPALTASINSIWKKCFSVQILRIEHDST